MKRVAARPGGGERTVSVVPPDPEPAGARARTEPDDTPGTSSGSDGRVAAVRRRVDEAIRTVTGWLDRRRTEALPYDLAVRFYERDRDSFASVLGAALAMRLFLFLVPLLVFAIGTVIAIFGPAGIGTVLEGSSVTGSMATQIRDATETTRTGGVLLMVTGLWLSLWAGRSLTRVLAACAAGAWRITGRASRATLRMAATVTGLVTALIVVLAFMNRAREEFSLPVATTSWLATAVILSFAWFVVSWTLPRGTTDPGALLPGAVVTGLSLTGLQWVMQYYLPGRLERASDLTGSLGVTLAALGYLFMIGRVMASSLILNAVIWERVGSITGLVFGLPFLRRIPEGSPRVAHFFDLASDRREPGDEPAPDDRPPGEVAASRPD